MSKGNKRRSNREVKKPKQKKEKPHATANFAKAKPAVTIGGVSK